MFHLLNVELNLTVLGVFSIVWPIEKVWHEKNMNELLNTIHFIYKFYYNSLQLYR